MLNVTAFIPVQLLAHLTVLYTYEVYGCKVRLLSQY